MQTWQLEASFRLFQHKSSVPKVKHEEGIETHFLKKTFNYNGTEHSQGFQDAFSLTHTAHPHVTQTDSLSY